MEINISDNVKMIKQRIVSAAVKCGRDPDSIKLLAVTKTIPTEYIIKAIDAGITMIGENYVQEAKDKIAAIGSRAGWHMIGHLQTNKAKYVVALFDYVHSVDRLELAQELNRRAGLINRKLNILIEINVSGEKSKSGIPADDTPALIKQIAGLKNLAVRGLMTMAPYSNNPENARPYFCALRNLRDNISRQQISEIQLEELSMGMTDDFIVAIEEGATIVRIGRAIFGERKES